MTAKVPSFPFYPGDWLKDPAVSRCHPATRGVWLDLICAMHENDRSGEVKGTIDQLARTARCTAAELQAAVDEIKSTGAGDVQARGQNGHAVVTVRNRRMYRAAKERAAARKRQLSHRARLDAADGHGEITGASRNGHANVQPKNTLSSSSSSPSGDIHIPSPTPSQGKGMKGRRVTKRQREALGAFAGREVGDGKAYLREAHRLLGDLLRTGGLHREERDELDGYLALFEQQPNEAGLEFFRQKLEGDRA